LKTNNITDVTKIIIFAGTVIIVCVLCALGFKMANEGKAAVNSGTSQFNDMAADYQDVGLSIYDNATVLGSEVTNLIKKMVAAGNTDYASISVKTLRNPTTGECYSYEFNGTNALSGSKLTVEPTTTKSSVDYINPSAEFTGKIYKDTNNNIICVEFTQK